MGRIMTTILTLLGYFLLLLQQQSILVHAHHKVNPMLQHGQHPNNNTYAKQEMWPTQGSSSNFLLNSENPDCPFLFELEIHVDDYAYEVYWYLNSDEGYYLDWAFFYNDTTIEVSFCIPPGSYNFTMFDSADDGLCCDFGRGSYKFSVDGVVIKEGGKYGSMELTSFDLEAQPTVSPAPTQSTVSPTPTIAPSVSPTVSCSSDEAMLGVEIQFSDDPEAISWNLTDSFENLVFSSEEFSFAQAFKRVYREYCISLGVYTFTIYYYNGFGLVGGYYNVSVDGDSIIEGTSFFLEESTTFATPNTPTQAPSLAPTIQCGFDESLFDLIIQLDIFPDEVSWNLTNSDEESILQGGPYAFKQALDLVGAQICIPLGSYTFTMFDRFGDGLCCGGFYNISLDGNQIKYGDGLYGYQEVTHFVTPGVPTGAPSPSPSQSPTVTGIPTISPTPPWTAFPTSAPTVECTANEVTFELDIKLDGDPYSISWVMTDSDGNELLLGDGSSSYTGIVHKEVCLSAGSYVFTIFDYFGDGLCCTQGPFYGYKLRLDGVVVKKGAPFGYSESTNLEVAPPRPSKKGIGKKHPGKKDKGKKQKGKKGKKKDMKHGSMRPIKNNGRKKDKVVGSHSKEGRDGPLPMRIDGTKREKNSEDYGEDSQ